MKELETELSRVVKYFNHVVNNIVDWKPNGSVQSCVIETEGYTIQFDRKVINGEIQMELMDKYTTFLTVTKPKKKNIFIDNKVARAEYGKLLKFKLGTKELRVTANITPDEIFNLSLMHNIEINAESVKYSMIVKNVANSTKKFIEMNLNLDLDMLKKTIIV
ncbi:hypothetical protein XaC1_204 [Xanthomonas phage XaC1]|nr:hypothetical protein XaC1_204 [Xanthomonas phage XaC1]